MNKRTQINLLRNEHKIAINDFDFDRAENISKQINRLQNELKNDFSPLIIDQDIMKEEYLTQTLKQKTLNTQKKLEIQQKYHLRFQKLQERHTQELTELALQHSLTLEREISRPIHEVEQKLLQSKTYGKNHEYDMAKKLFNESQIIKNSIIEKRKKNCEDFYKKQKEKIEKRQLKEIELLTDKQKNDLENLEKLINTEETKLINLKNVSKLKTTRKLREIPHITNYMTPKKRSLSVTKK